MHRGHATDDDGPAATRAVRWLRVLKLLLTVVLLALTIWNALGGPGVAPLP